MFPNNIEFIGRERHADRFKEAEQIRLAKLARSQRPGGWLKVRQAFSWLVKRRLPVESPVASLELRSTEIES